MTPNPKTGPVEHSEHVSPLCGHIRIHSTKALSVGNLVSVVWKENTFVQSDKNLVANFSKNTFVFIMLLYCFWLF